MHTTPLIARCRHTLWHLSLWLMGVLGGVCVILWVRSQFAMDEMLIPLKTDPDDVSVWFVSMRGELVMRCTRYPAARFALAGYRDIRSRWGCATSRLPSTRPSDLTAHEVFGFGWANWGRQVPEEIPFWLIVVPHWSLVLALWVFPAVRARQIVILRRRKRRGLCLYCGYDLRASGAICSECGHTRDNSKTGVNT